MQTQLNAETGVLSVQVRVSTGQTLMRTLASTDCFAALRLQVPQGVQSNKLLQRTAFFRP